MDVEGQRVGLGGNDRRERGEFDCYQGAGSGYLKWLKDPANCHLLGAQMVK